MSYNLGDIYFAEFPLEEDKSQYLNRPIIIVVAELPELVVIKVTKTAPRANDKFDVPIIKYQEAGLKFPSTARVSKVITLNEKQIIRRIGSLHPDDLEAITEKLIELTEK
jgi:mRNA-degrading endonuclease toxin of MazEF toxin-antitoxin module